MVIYAANSYTYYYQFSITHSFFDSRLKTFLFCKLFPLQPFILLQGTDYVIHRTFTLTSSILLFSFSVLHFSVVASVR